jgi:hypothetical protein
MKYTQLLWGLWGFFVGMVFASIYCGYNKLIHTKVLNSMNNERPMNRIFSKLYKLQPVWSIRVVATFLYVLLLVIGSIISIRTPLLDMDGTIGGIITILGSLLLQITILVIFWLIIRSYKRGTLKYSHFKTQITLLGETKIEFLFIILLATVCWHTILLVRYL